MNVFRGERGGRGGILGFARAFALEPPLLLQEAARRVVSQI